MFIGGIPPVPLGMSVGIIVVVAVGIIVVVAVGIIVIVAVGIIVAVAVMVGAIVGTVAGGVPVGIAVAVVIVAVGWFVAVMLGAIVVLGTVELVPAPASASLPLELSPHAPIKAPAHTAPHQGRARTQFAAPDRSPARIDVFMSNLG